MDEPTNDRQELDYLHGRIIALEAFVAYTIQMFYMDTRKFLDESGKDLKGKIHGDGDPRTRRINEGIRDGLEAINARVPGGKDSDYLRIGHFPNPKRN